MSPLLGDGRCPASPPGLLVSTWAHAWILGRASRRKNPCLHRFPLPSQGPGTSGGSILQGLYPSTEMRQPRGVSQDLTLAPPARKSRHSKNSCHFSVPEVVRAARGHSVRVSATCSPRRWHLCTWNRFRRKQAPGDASVTNPCLYLHTPSSVCVFFTRTNGGSWSEASQGFQSVGLGAL